MSRLKLLKLLYIAERTMIQERDHAFLFDRPVAMPHGPVPSEIYDLIKGLHAQHAAWAEFFENDGNVVLLTEEPPRGALSRFEIGLLTRIATEYADKDEWQIVDETHKFPEWTKNYPGNGSAAPIPWLDLVGSLNKPYSQAIADEIEEERRLRRALDGVAS